MTDSLGKTTDILNRSDIKSPSQLQEVTMDPNFTTSCQSPIQGSPVQGRTMKDYEEQLSTLRKENFNLKLNVYFLEERLCASNMPASEDNIMKKNIELKVNLESLRRDLNEKETLLCDAGRALELMESSAARKEADLLSQISSMEDELHQLRNAGLKIDDDENSVVPGINTNNITMGVDDSVALYAAAFNLCPMQSEVENLQKKNNKNEMACECQQLKALLTIERENILSLRDAVAKRDQQISDQKQLIEDLEHMRASIMKTDESNSDNNDQMSENMKNSAVNHQLERLQQENLNACQMIQGCLVRIKQMDKENKKIKSILQEKESVISKLQAEESTDDKIAMVQKYQELLDVRDSKITKLENQLKTLSALKEMNVSKSSHSDEKEFNWVNSHLEKKINTLRESVCVKPENGSADTIVNKDCMSPSTNENKQMDIQEMLVRRLQEMGYFLDSLLSHRCIIGEDKRRKVENLLEQTIELPVGLKLDINASQVLEDTFMDVSFGKPSHTLRLEDLTTIFGHHMSLDDTCASQKLIKYDHLEETRSKENYPDYITILKTKELIIENLNNQIKNMKEHCICESGENSDDNQSSFIMKSSCCEYNKLLSRKDKTKHGRGNKMYLNTTWNGFDGSHVDRSESECWSEPDRNVSLARMGGPLEDNAKEIVSSEEEICSRRQYNSNILQKSVSIIDGKIVDSKDQIKSLLEEKSYVERLLQDANIKIMNLQNNLEVNNTKHSSEVKSKQDEIDRLDRKLQEAEITLKQYLHKYKVLAEQFEKEKLAINDELENAQKQISAASNALSEEQKQNEHTQALLHLEIKEIRDSSNHKIKEIQEKIEVDWVSRVRYEAMRRELDNAVLQASQATLDRALATEQKTRSDAEADRFRIILKEAQLRVSELENMNVELQNRLVRMETWHTSATRALSSPAQASDSSPQAVSPDHSIESEHLSIVELIESTSSNEKFNTRDLATENVMLRERLERTQRALESTVMQLKNARYPQKIQRAMCQEIHKTTSILRQVRENLNYDS